MRVVTHNVNGIRAAMRRGFREWLDATDADIVALQEVRCRVDDLPDGAFGDYHVAYEPGNLAGRNGVALLTREAPAKVFSWRDAGSTDVHEFASEGRLVGVELADAPLTVVSVYVPKGGVPLEVAPPAGGREGFTPEHNQARYERKLAFLQRFADELDALHVAAEDAGRHLLVLGDYNIAHGPADVKNWRTNIHNEGFLPAERAWLDATIGRAWSAGRLDGKKILAPSLDWPALQRPLVDVVRALHQDEDGPYSWWSWRGQSFTNDVGWRIDYHLASPALAEKAKTAWVDRAPDYDHRISDHAPVVVDYDI